MKQKIFIRGVRKIENGVFAVDKNGQKQYYDAEFGVWVPFASGQQVKRCVIEKSSDILDLKMSTVEFIFKASTENVSKGKKKKLAEHIAKQTCNPSDFDQLIGGYMNTELGVKRTSPLSLNAFVPLHVFLCTTNKELISFDRRNSNGIYSFYDDKNNPTTPEEIQKVLETGEIEKAKAMKYIPDNKRANGLFRFDIEIDINRLFAVDLSEYNPEIKKEMEEELVAKGWQYNKEKTHLLMPEDKRPAIIDAIAYAVVHWTFNSNKSRTLNANSTLAVAITDKPNDVTRAIRAKIVDEENKKAKMVLDFSKGNVFISPEIEEHLEIDYKEELDLEVGIKYIADKIKSFKYE